MGQAGWKDRWGCRVEDDGSHAVAIDVNDGLSQTSPIRQSPEIPAFVSERSAQVPYVVGIVSRRVRIDGNASCARVRQTLPQTFADIGLLVRSAAKTSANVVAEAGF